MGLQYRPAHYTPVANENLSVMRTNIYTYVSIMFSYYSYIQSEYILYYKT